jgi:hypothetical protein
MAVTTVTTTMAGAINYTVVTDTSAGNFRVEYSELDVALIEQLVEEIQSA